MRMVRATGGRPESVEAFAAANAYSDSVLGTATTLAVLRSDSHRWRVHFHVCAYLLE